MKWWVYKCNSKNHGYQNAVGDWNDFFAEPHKHWGCSDWVPSLLQLKKGDSVLAYQTDRNELVGVATVRKTCEDDTFLFLDAVERFSLKLRALRESNPQIAAISAFKSGPIRTLYEIPEADANALIRAARKPTSQSPSSVAFYKAKTMDGNSLYQQRARQVLPILVRQARARRTIHYGDLSEEVGMQNARNLDFVLGSIGRTLEELAKRQNETIPQIQSIVINRTTGLPGDGYFDPKFKQLSKKQKQVLIDAALADVFGYPRWDDVLKALRLRPVEAPPTLLIESARMYRGGGESKEHRQLKEFVAANPPCIGLSATVGEGKTEVPIPSGDCLDILFATKRARIAVEIKSKISPIGDVVRGLFQCVKYSAVLNAWHDANGLKLDTRTLLVLETEFPKDLISLRNALGVEVVDNVRSKA